MGGCSTQEAHQSNPLYKQERVPVNPSTYRHTVCHTSCVIHDTSQNWEPVWTETTHFGQGTRVDLLSSKQGLGTAWEQAMHCEVLWTQGNPKQGALDSLTYATRHVIASILDSSRAFNTWHTSKIQNFIWDALVSTWLLVNCTVLLRWERRSKWRILAGAHGCRDGPLEHTRLRLGLDLISIFTLEG